MTDLIPALQAALRDAIRPLLPDPAAADTLEIPVLAVPDDKPGDYGSPVAFGLARVLRRAPPQIAADLASHVVAPPGVARVEAVGPYLNAYVDPGAFVRSVVAAPLELPASGRKVVVEHTSVNPNKEAHVGHLRNVVLGDAVARIERAAGHRVEVQNYIDDTGRQAAESLFAIRYFGETPPADEKYDHWLGRLYVRLGEAKASAAEAIERGVSEVMHQLERGELRDEVERIVRAQLVTYHALGAEYDLLVWESDVVAAGFLQRGLAVLEALPTVSRPAGGKFAGALVMDVSEFLPGLEEPSVVLVRSDGNAMYVAKDIGYHLWKVGRLEGMAFRAFADQPSGATLWTTHPAGVASDLRGAVRVGGPQGGARRLLGEGAVRHARQPPHLPQVVADVLGDVHGVAVAADQHDQGLLQPWQEGRDVHDQGAGELALARARHGGQPLEHLEAPLQEAGGDDVGLPHQQVVLGAEPVVGLELGAHDALDVVPQLTALEAVHHLGDAALDRLARDRLGLAEPDVQAAQPVVVLLVLGRGLAEVANREEALRRLPTGVVDVVLDLDPVAGGALDAGDGIAQDDVAQVADVGLLVGVDAGVLDDHLAAGGGQVQRRRHHRAHEGTGVDVGVQVGAYGLDACHA